MKKIFLIFIFALLFLNLSNYTFAQTSDEIVILHTQSGKIAIELFPKDAPKTVENFLKLADSGFYDDIIFHRIIKDFMIQGGDPLSKQLENKNSWGTGNAGYNIPAEFNTIKHNRGIVSMARAADPNSASSQFFIVHKNSNFLDEQYTVFGRIVTQESFEALDRITSLETGARDVPIDTEQAKILRVEVKQRTEIPDLLELGDPERVLSSQVIPSDEKYTDEKFGISFTAPAGWSIQHPQKTAPQSPDIVVVGPQTSEINPVISVTVVYSDGKSIDDHLAESKSSLQPAIDEGKMEIISEEKIKVNGKDAYVLEALGLFESRGTTTNVKFKQVLIGTPEKFYTLTYTNTENNFESNLERFDVVVNSFAILSEAQTTNGEETQDEGGGCLIATATFGSELTPQIQHLRELRDNTVLNTESGTAFMTGFNQLYYSFSPTIADWERESPAFKEFVKLVITPMLASLSILNYVDINSEEEMLGYGIGIILMNIGMYFVAPAMVVYRLRK